MRPISSGLTTLLLSMAVFGCDRSVGTAPSGETPEFQLSRAPYASVARARLLRDTIPPLYIGAPLDPRPWDGGVDALRAAVATTNGRVMIGLKPDGALRTASTGVVPGMSRRVFTDALDRLIQTGVTVLETYRNLTSVTAVIDADDVEELVDLPFINNIEPAPIVRGAVTSFSSSATLQTASQDTTRLGE